MYEVAAKPVVKAAMEGVNGMTYCSRRLQRENLLLLVMKSLLALFEKS